MFDKNFEWFDGASLNYVFTKLVVEVGERVHEHGLLCKLYDAQNKCQVAE